MNPHGDESRAAPCAPDVRSVPAPATTSTSTGRAARAVPPPPCRALTSDALFGGASEVHISHRGSVYRLKQTALGKLILTK